MSTEQSETRGRDAPRERKNRAIPPPLLHTRRAMLLGAVTATAGCATSTPRSSRAAVASTAPTTFRRESTSSTSVKATSTSTPTGGPAVFAAHGSSSSSHVALTFHTDGDVGLAGQLLDLLAGRRVRVTTL